MNTKKVFIIFVFIGIILFLMGLKLPAIAEDSESLLLGDFYGPTDDEYYIINEITECGMRIFESFGIGMLVCGAFGLIFNKTVNKHCHIKTTVTSMYISADLGFALFSLFMFVFGCHFFTTPENHPIMYPASIIFMILSFLAFCGLMYFYVIFRKERKTFVGVLIDCATSLIFTVGFFLVFLMLYFVAIEVFDYYTSVEEIATKVINAGLFIIPILTIFIIAPTVISFRCKKIKQ